MNTRSSTESKLVGVGDAIGFVEWASLYSKEGACILNGGSRTLDVLDVLGNNNDIRTFVDV